MLAETGLHRDTLYSLRYPTKHDYPYVRCRNINFLMMGAALDLTRGYYEKCGVCGFASQKPEHF